MKILINYKINNKLLINNYKKLKNLNKYLVIKIK